MHTIKLRSHVGPDGLLKLEVAVGVKNTDLDVVVNVEPVGFFEETAGSIPDLPEIDRQEDYEIREPIDWDNAR